MNEHGMSSRRNGRVHSHDDARIRLQGRVDRHEVGRRIKVHAPRDITRKGPTRDCGVPGLDCEAVGVESRETDICCHGGNIPNNIPNKIPNNISNNIACHPTPRNHELLGAIHADIAVSSVIQSTLICRLELDGRVLGGLYQE